MLEECGDLISEELWKAADDLTPSAVETRYPRDADPVTEEEFRRLLAQAELIVAWAERIVGFSKEKP